jgi:hypothetical protein
MGTGGPTGAFSAGPAWRSSRHAVRGGETSRRLGAQGGLGKVRADSGGVRHGCLGRPARGRAGDAWGGAALALNISVCPVWRCFSPNFSTKVR